MNTKSTVKFAPYRINTEKRPVGFNVQYNNAVLGSIDREVDGFFYFTPNQGAKGFWAAWIMRQIADKLDEINMLWSEEIANLAGAHVPTTTPKPLRRVHELKTWPSFYKAIERGEKTFEVRRNDRDFEVGDLLCLKEWDPGKETPPPLTSLQVMRFTGHAMYVEVTYVLPGGRFGIDPEYCVMGIKKVAAE